MNSTNSHNLSRAKQLMERDKLAAREILQEVVTQQPGDWEGWLLLAACESLMQDYQTAVECLRQADRCRPGEVLVLRNLAYCYRQQGELLLAQHYFQAAHELAGVGDIELSVLLASTWAELGQRDRALRLLGEAQAASPGHPLPVFYRFLLGDGVARSQLLALVREQNVLRYLVSFSMKHDCYLFRELDDKAGLARLARRVPPGFHPQSFILPGEREALQAAHGVGDSWALKYPNLSGGQALRITTSPLRLGRGMEPVVAQRYIHEPLLLEGRKFNLRLYLVITALDPLEAQLWHDGLLFIAPEPFSMARNALGRERVHIANLLASGEGLEDAPLGDFDSHLLSLEAWFASGHLHAEGQQLVAERLRELAAWVLQLIERTAILAYHAALPVAGSFAPKFLGLDVIIDRDLQPWLLEIERYPGMGGVFPESLAVNTRFQRDYLGLLLGTVSVSRFHPVKPCRGV